MQVLQTRIVNDKNIARLAGTRTGFTEKRMNFKNLLIGVALAVCGSAHAATIFAPTDGDLNFMFGSLGGGTLAMFDDSDQSYLGLNLVVDVPGIVGIAGPFANNDHIASNTNGSLTLTGSDQFILGLNIGGNWLADTSVVSIGANAYQVSFDNAGTLVQVDVRIVAPPVPVPAAVWLFGSGLLGLVGIARRKKVA
jgi:hypothetical protein